MKLKEWADKQGISYLTAWRWFKAGDPRLAKAYQSDSGTIIVPDENDSSEQAMAVNNTQNDVMSLFLKKTVEFSKNNSTVEDFAAYVLSNFSLKLTSQEVSPKYSKQKPKPEEIQKHFKQFLPDKEKEEHLKAVKTLIKEQHQEKAVEPFVQAANESATDSVDYGVLSSAFSETISEELLEEVPVPNVCLYDSNKLAEGLITRSVDLNTTPQQINYTGSTDQAFSNNFARIGAASASSSSLSFQPTQKELQSAAKVVETAESTADDLPRRRGRKPSKKR